jgi:predicted transposase YbfD/YdcC
MESPLQFFAGLTDPRVERTETHLLEDIIFIAIASVICWAETWNEMEDFGKAKGKWLRTFLKLPNDIPTHDTFNRVFSALEPEQFEECFLKWTRWVSELTAGEVVSFDGKTLRRSAGRSNSKRAVHLVSAWAGTNNLVLGQRKVDEKSNEITAIPPLLEVLALAECIVAIDAMDCQREIAKAIVGKEAHYILAVKVNQAQLHEQVQDSFRFVQPDEISTEHDLGTGA